MTHCSLLNIARHHNHKERKIPQFQDPRSGARAKGMRWSVSLRKSLSPHKQCCLVPLGSAWEGQGGRDWNVSGHPGVAVVTAVSHATASSVVSSSLTFLVRSVGKSPVFILFLLLFQPSYKRKKKRKVKQDRKKVLCVCVCV